MHREMIQLISFLINSSEKRFFFFLNRKDVYCSNDTSPAKPEGLSAGAHAAVKQGCSTA